MSLVSTYLMAFFAMVCYAFMPVFLKKLQFDVPPFMLIAITMAGLCVLAFALSLFWEKDFSVLKISPKSWAGLMAFSAVNLVGFVVMLVVISKIPVVQYQLICLATPVVGALFAFWMLNEGFRSQYLIGLGFIAVGLFIALRKTGS